MINVNNAMVDENITSFSSTIGSDKMKNILTDKVSDIIKTRQGIEFQ